MSTVSVERMCEDTTPRHGHTPHRPPKQSKLTTDVAQHLRQHLKRLQDVAPEKMRVGSSRELVAETPHGPTKLQQLHLIFPKPWPQTRIVQQRAPHQPAHQAHFSPQPTLGNPLRSAPGGVPSSPSQVFYFQPSSSTSAGTRAGTTTDKRPLNGTGAPVDKRRWTVHAPVSQAVCRHLQDTIKDLKAVPVRMFPNEPHSHRVMHQSHVAEGCTRTREAAPGADPHHCQPHPAAIDCDRECLRGQGAAHPPREWHPAPADLSRCTPLIQPGSPKPRVKVWEYAPYSLHAPTMPRSGGGRPVGLTGAASVGGTTSSRRKRKRPHALGCAAGSAAHNQLCVASASRGR